MHVHVEQEVAAPASVVWELVGDLANAKSWPFVESYEMAGSGVGCVRTLRFVGGDRLVERLDARDAERRTYTASVLDAGNLHVRDLHYSVSVADSGADRCTIEWDASFEAEGAPAELVRGRVEGFYISTTASIRDMLRV